jgi:hypothetical protein
LIFCHNKVHTIDFRVLCNVVGHLLDTLHDADRQGLTDRLHYGVWVGHLLLLDASQRVGREAI